MNGLAELCLVIIKKHKIELILLAFAILSTSLSLYSTLKSDTPPSPSPIIPTRSVAESKKDHQQIIIDVQGAVKNPDAYSIESGARLKDIIKISGGLSEQADVLFFAREFNLAEKLSDGQKIYIPSRSEVLSKQIQTQSASSDSQSDIPLRINLNTASREELDTLPGIGSVSADKIIGNRPYSSLDELLNKKIVNSSTFEKIKDLVTTI